MSRRPSDRRRRLGHRPPNRSKGAHPPSRPGGFTGHGLGPAYRVILPGLTGSAKKQFFNQVSGGMILGAGLGGAVIGLGLLGPLGAVLGLGAGVAAGASLARSQGFHRG